MVCLGALQTSFLETHDLTVFGSKHLDPGASWHNTRAPVPRMRNAVHHADRLPLEMRGCDVDSPNRQHFFKVLREKLFRYLA